MAKRFTDTEKWTDAFFMDLSPPHKLFFLYLLDNCDHAGLWKVNMRLASFQIGESIDESQAITAFKDRIEVVGEKWFLTKFIQFQYKGILNPLDKVHSSVIKILESNNIDTSPFLAPSMGLPSPYQGAKVKDIVKDKVKENESFEKFWAVCSDKRGKLEAEKAFNKLPENEKELAIKYRPVYDAACKRKGTEQQYIKSPGPWINAKRWEDILNMKTGCQHDYRKIMLGFVEGEMKHHFKCSICGSIKK